MIDMGSAAHRETTQSTSKPAAFRKSLPVPTNLLATTRTDTKEDKEETSNHKNEAGKRSEKDTKSRCSGGSLLLMPSRRAAGHSCLTVHFSNPLASIDNCSVASCSPHFRTKAVLPKSLSDGDCGKGRSRLSGLGAGLEAHLIGGT